MDDQLGPTRFDDQWLGSHAQLQRELLPDGTLKSFGCQVGQRHITVDLEQMTATTVEKADPELTEEEWLDGWRFRVFEEIEPPSFEQKCGFCGKTNREVAKLIAGPSVFICNECIELCWEIVNEH